MSSRPGTRSGARPAVRRPRTGRPVRDAPAGSPPTGPPRAARPDRRAPRPPRRVLGVRRRTALAVGLALALGLVATAWFSPLLVVREVTVRGTTVVAPEQVVAALDVPLGTRLLPLDTGAAQQRVADALPRLDTVTVSRSLPSGLTVTVTERTAAAWIQVGDEQHLVDSAGVDFATEAPAPGLVQLAGVDDPSTDAARAALQVLGELPDGLRTQVSAVSADTPDAVTLQLSGDRSVLWGGTTDAARKAVVLTALLSQPAASYDVSSPDLPTTS